MDRIIRAAAFAATCLAMVAAGLSRADTPQTRGVHPLGGEAVLGARPEGLMAVIKNDPAQPLNPATFSDPYIAGVAIQIHWNDIEASEGSPDWSRLDAFVADAAAAGKWVQISVYPGFFTPAWALKGVQTDNFKVPYGPDAGQVMVLPMPWDATYLQRWLGFVKALSARYAGAAAVRMIAVDGPTSVSDENTLPNSPAELKQWQDDGYTPTKYLAAWKRVLRAYGADFPGQYLSIAGVGGLAINDAGKIDASQHTATPAALASEAAAILGPRFAVEYNNLDGTAGPDKQGGIAFVMSYIGSAVTGLQMRASAAGAGMGPPGASAPDKLRDAISKGLRLNAANQHIDYLQIYEPDILAPDMQPVLAYGASLFGAVRSAPPRPPPCGAHCR